MEEGPLCPQVSCIILPSRVYQGWKAQKPNCCRDGCTPPAKSQLLLRGWWTPPQYIFKQRDANGTWNSAAAAGLVDPPAQVFKRSVMYDGRVPSCCGGGVDPPLANLQLLLLRRRGCTLSAAAWGHGGDNHHLREARRPDEWPTLISDKCIQG